MPRGRSPGSDDSDGDIDGMAEKEQEHAKLRRRYRIMEGDRKAYCLESQDAIQRQRAEIAQLKREKKEVETDLRLIDSGSNQNRDDRHVSSLGELGSEKEKVNTLINEELEKQEELKAKIRQWEKDMKSQHKNMGGVHQSHQQNVKTQREVKKLENQLENANNKFSHSLEHNKQLRDEIDSLQVERERFDNLYKRLDKELQQLRQEIGEVIDQSTQAYDQRDDAQTKMMMLKEKAEKDLQQHNAEMKELVRIIDHDRKLREFMNTKTKERQEDVDMAGWRERKEAQEAAKKKASQTDSVESYEEAFEKIRSITEEEEIDLIVNKFIEVEDKNFALYSFCSELSNRVEKLDDDIRDIKQEIEKFELEGTETEEQRKVILTELEKQQNVASKKADEAIENHKGVSKILDQLNAGVDSLFNKISCDKSNIEDMLGADAGVTDSNMIQYLGIIENRTNQLLTMQTFIENKKEAEHDQGRLRPKLLGPGPQPSFIQRTVTPPSVGEEYESDGSRGSDDDKPMTQEELRERAIRNAKRREQKGKKENTNYDLATDGRDTKKSKDKSKK